MKKTGVILLGFLPNPRFEKRIAVEKNLCDLHVICWNRGNYMMKVLDEDGFKMHCIEIKAQNDPLKRLIPYYKFSCTAKKIIKQLNPDYIHVQGLDMLRIAYAMKKVSKKHISIIYEVADLHRLMVDKQKNPIKKFAKWYMRKGEVHYCKIIDTLLVTSREYYSTYFSEFINENKLMYFPNVPDLSVFNNYKKKDSSKDFTIGFIGCMRYEKQMKNLIVAAKQCDVRLYIAGFEVNPPEIQKLCNAYKRGQWIGRFDFEKQVSELYGNCDVMYSVYDADMANVRVALPNKLYEAIYCEIPLIVAKHTYLAQIVEELRIGVAVDYREPEELIDVLKELKNNTSYYQELCKNCRQHKKDIDLKSYNDKLQILIQNFLRDSYYGDGI